MQSMTPILATTGFFAGLNMLILFWIGTETGKLRKKHKVSIGDGAVPHLIRILRGHANAVENMPMFFVMFLIAALLGMPLVAALVIGLSFTAGRAVHAWHFIQEDAPGWQRGGGFMLGFLAQAVLMLGLMGHGLWAVFMG